MGDLVKIDFNDTKQDDLKLHLAKEPDTNESSYRARLKREEEILYRRTLKRLRRDIKKARSLKKEKAYQIIKRLFDVSVSGAGIAVLSPFFAGLMLAIYLSDGEQPIFSQVRLGKNGKNIRIYKFRSMHIDAEDMERVLNKKQLEQFHAEYKIDNDPRITKIGRFIRKTSLDELPQLFNVLEGDMTLVGPRPIVKGEMPYYENKNLKRLLSVKPGLTGYWQAYARNKATYRDGLRQNMELYYVDHKGLGFDLKILVKTVISVLKQEGAQ